MAYHVEIENAAARSLVRLAQGDRASAKRVDQAIKSLADVTFVPISEAKGRLSELVREADSHEVLLMRHSRPAAVLLSHARYEALVEKLEDALDRLSVHEREGVTMDYDKLRAELGFDDD